MREIVSPPPGCRRCPAVADGIREAAILNTVLPDAPDHPGVAHYLIHSLDYLEYAYLQLGQDRNAAGVVSQVAKVKETDVPQFAAAYAFAAVPVRYPLERRQWADAARLTVAPGAFPWERYPYAEALTHFARGLGAARSGSLPVAREALARLEAIQIGRVRARDDY